MSRNSSSFQPSSFRGLRQSADRSGMAHGKLLGDPAIAHRSVVSQQDGELNLADIAFPQAGLSWCIVKGLSLYNESGPF